MALETSTFLPNMDLIDDSLVEILKQKIKNQKLEIQSENAATREESALHIADLLFEIDQQLPYPSDE
jgi:hypothetical protein